MGSRVGKSAGPAHYSGARKPAGAGSRARFLDERPHPTLPQDEGSGTMNIGFNQSLPIVPFDHRGSFETKMFRVHAADRQGALPAVGHANRFHSDKRRM